jgi:anti-anti-sigma factor
MTARTNEAYGAASSDGARQQSRPEPPPLTVTVEELAGGVLLRLQGQAQISTVGLMQLAVERLVARRVPLVILDLSELTFLGSLAMSALVVLRRDLQPWGGRVEIAGIRPLVYESLEVTGLHRLFAFRASVEEALAA